MTNSFESRLQRLQASSLPTQLKQILRGLEKESLRIQPNGHLAQTLHPRGLGSTLTHPSITTDYSEALMEFITPAFTDVEAPLDFLHQLHQFAYAVLDNEKLWVNSMPCILGAEENIPIAEYGTSNNGRLKHIYRHGLWHRYGRAMQTIAGIHYNMSYPESFWRGYQEQLLQESGQPRQGKDSRPLQAFISDQYFHLIRNFQRHVSIVIYLFGASPAVCGSFLRGQKHQLTTLHKHTLAAPWGTSLRMSDLGYHNTTQMGLNVSYNSLDEYVETLYKAASTPNPDYEKIGVLVDGEYRQLNTNILQIENEYYASIRPKRRLDHHMRTLTALADGGVEYVEIRCMDLNPYLPIGIDADSLRFLDMFALFCLLEDSPPLSPREYKCMHDNQQTIVLNGRNPAHEMQCAVGAVNFKGWATQVLNQLEGIAALFDGVYGGNHYQRVLDEQKQRVEHPDTTPSARIVKTLMDEDMSFFEFGMQRAKQTEKYFCERPLAPDVFERFSAEAAKSLIDQQKLEAEPQVEFAQYLANFLAQRPVLTK